MADRSKFGQMPPAAPGGGGLRCEEWEALLADALDGLLPASQAAAFTAHSDTCAGCADLLAHAKQGQEWLGYLHTEPDVPAGLLGKILDKTAGAGAIPLPAVAGTGATTGAAAAALPWRRNFHEARLLMTVAMAFFSIALTLDMAGVRLGSIRLADLRPSTIGSTLSRQFYGTRGQVIRFYDNLRFVYQLESRMRELRRDVQSAQPATPPKSQPSQPHGNGNKDGLLNPGPGAILDAQEPVTPGLHPSLRPAHREEGTEAKRLSPLGLYRAGPRRTARTAGYDGRSLA